MHAESTRPQLKPQGPSAAVPPGSAPDRADTLDKRAKRARTYQVGAHEWNPGQPVPASHLGSSLDGPTICPGLIGDRSTWGNVEREFLPFLGLEGGNRADDDLPEARAARDAASAEGLSGIDPSVVSCLAGGKAASAWEGLSTVHISTRAQGGSFFCLHGEAREEFEERETPKRGKVSEFSRRSRRRLMTSLAIVNQEEAGIPSMLSLTYPDEGVPWPIPESKVKRDLGVFRLRFERRYGKRPILWRRETQTRKSGAHRGELAPHVHALVWGTVPTREDRDWISRTWYEIVGSGEPKHLRAGTQWFQPESWRGTLAYVSKYHAKLSDVPTVGRSWGYWRRELLPVKLLSDEIPQDAFHPVRRVLRRYIERKTGRRVRLYSRGQGLCAYLSEVAGARLVRWAWDVGWTVGEGGE